MLQGNAQFPCRGCGYVLNGLPENRCPECGRPFDPGNPRTLDTSVQKRRRLCIKIGALLAALIMVAAFAPLKMLDATTTFTCKNCSASKVVKRWEPQKRSWMPDFLPRYPGFSWPSEHQAAKPCGEHLYDVSVSFQSPIVLRGSGGCKVGKGEVAEINGLKLTPDTAAGVLHALMAPSNNGIRVRVRSAAPARQ